MRQTLIIGYGNLDRGDDGAAFHVVNRLRGHLGLRPLAEDDSGLERLPNEAAVFVPQLTPELALDAAPFTGLVLVDAHVTAEVRPLICQCVQPKYRPPAVSHLLPPAMFLWLVQSVAGQDRSGLLVSLRGRCFDLRRGLSAETSALVAPAAERVLELIHAAPSRNVTDQMSALSSAR
jgi:Ni,Fe-hydrogenase maturation factor